MAGEYRPAKGDRVRVVLEGEVLAADENGFRIDSFVSAIPSLYIGAGYAKSIVSIEKVEPPVEVFRRGDVVRSKADTECVFALAQNGYIDLLNGIWNTCRSGRFTSKDYERVTLS